AAVPATPAVRLHGESPESDRLPDPDLRCRSETAVTKREAGCRCRARVACNQVDDPPAREKGDVLSARRASLFRPSRNCRTSSLNSESEVSLGRSTILGPLKP